MTSRGVAPCQWGKTLSDAKLHSVFTRDGVISIQPEAKQATRPAHPVLELDLPVPARLNKIIAKRKPGSSGPEHTEICAIEANRRETTILMITPSCEQSAFGSRRAGVVHGARAGAWVQYQLYL